MILAGTGRGVTGVARSDGRGGPEAGSRRSDRVLIFDVAACRELAEELGVPLVPEQLAGPVWRQRIVQEGFVPGWDGVDTGYLSTRVDGQTGSALFPPRALPDLLDALAADGSGRALQSLGL